MTDKYKHIKHIKDTHMQRKITSHVINSANEKLTVTVMDEPGSGGANHLYKIKGFNSASNPSDPWTNKYRKPATHSMILFQNGPINEVGTNGLTHEVLLAIIADRLQGFQAGPYACDANRDALYYVECAIRELHKRTIERRHRGVEGTHTV